MATNWSNLIGRRDKANASPPPPYICADIVATRIIAVLAALLLLLATTIACSGEPQVRVVEVEKVVEVEVIREIVVTATPAATPVPPSPLPATPAPTTAPASQPAAATTPTPVPRSRSVLIVYSYPRDIMQTKALAFTEGIDVEIIDVETTPYNEADPPRDLKMIPGNVPLHNYRGMLVLGRPTYELLKQVRGFVQSGGKVAIATSCGVRLQEDIQFLYGISCADVNEWLLFRGPGSKVAPMFKGLVVEVYIQAQFFPSPSGDATCVSRAEAKTGSICTSVQGRTGDGQFIFLNYGYYCCGNTWFSDHDIDEKDHREAVSKMLNWLVEETSTSVLPFGDSSQTYFTDSFDASSVLARFSTSDPIEGERRASAVGEIIAQHKFGNVDTDRVLDLLHTIAPELSIEERREAADELAQLSENEKWDESDAARGVFYLSSLVTGDEPNADERIEAAHEMVALYEAGDLDADNALNLMDTIAPGLSINERRQAAAALARLASDGELDETERMAAASEVFRLVTGVPLNAEQRIGATVDLAGVGVKVFDTDDSFDDRDIDNATEIIKQSLTGELTTESLQGILGFGN